ncbi:CRISPR-associated endoribonuclease Cas6 [Bacillus sp. FJAT-42315]|uniref:CRISPR-associated endoribonuclease Cas6 n=1 Tax=Bacillus sp. FJAT-42315 TaxID=2014077 RepID=UPI000C24464F|nr:CRISPR-associated endoribonuclease Cas6 [Bacillus sp. FJAT-42315]
MLKLEVSFKTNRLMRRYNFQFASVIKAALSESNKTLVNELYEYQGRNNKKMKSFAGSVFLQSYEVKEDYFDVKGEVKLIISSPQADLMLYLYNGLVQKKQYEYKGYHLEVTNVRMLRERLPQKERVLFKALSPIVVKEKGGRFLSPTDPNYTKELNYTCNEIVKSIRGSELRRSIHFQPVLMKKNVVQLQHDSFKQLNDQSILYVEAYNGTFVLEGDVEDLQLLAQTGIGLRRGQMFGNIEFVDE